MSVNDEPCHIYFNTHSEMNSEYRDETQGVIVKRQLVASHADKPIVPCADADLAHSVLTTDRVKTLTFTFPRTATYI
jgi:hypothetical protein